MGNRIKRCKVLIYTLIAALILPMGISSHEVYAAVADSKDEITPSVIVYNCGDLVQAIDNAEDGDIIGIASNIELDSDVSVLGSDDKQITIIKAFEGAFIRMLDVDVIVKNIVFDGNSSVYNRDYDPMIQVEGKAEFENVTFQNCYNQWGGGAIKTEGGRIGFIGCHFVNNEASEGGHIMVGSSTYVKAIDSIFENGKVSRAGGAVKIEDNYGTGNDNEIVFVGCKMIGNQAGYGGAIANKGNAKIIDSIIYGNTAETGADILNYCGSSFEMDSIAELIELYATDGILPLEWEFDYVDQAYIEGNIDKENSLSAMKLKFEKIKQEDDSNLDNSDKPSEGEDIEDKPHSGNNDNENNSLTDSDNTDNSEDKEDAHSDASGDSDTGNDDSQNKDTTEDDSNTSNNPSDNEQNTESNNEQNNTDSTENEGGKDENDSTDSNVTTGGNDNQDVDSNVDESTENNSSNTPNIEEPTETNAPNDSESNDKNESDKNESDNREDSNTQLESDNNSSGNNSSENNNIAENNNSASDLGANVPNNNENDIGNNNPSGTVDGGNNSNSNNVISDSGSNGAQNNNSPGNDSNIGLDNHKPVDSDTSSNADTNNGSVDTTDNGTSQNGGNAISKPENSDNSSSDSSNKDTVSSPGSVPNATNPISGDNVPDGKDESIANSESENKPSNISNDSEQKNTIIKKKAIKKLSLTAKKGKRKIIGKTIKKATVKVKIGKRTYTVKSNAKGKFTVKLKGKAKLKKGQKIKVRVLKNGYKSKSNTFRVK